MEKEISLVLLALAGVILFLLLVYSFRTRVKLKYLKAEELEKFYESGIDENDILTLPPKNNVRRMETERSFQVSDGVFEQGVADASTRLKKQERLNSYHNIVADHPEKTVHIEPKLNALVIEDDFLAPYTQSKNNAKSTQSAVIINPIDNLRASKQRLQKLNPIVAIQTPSPYSQSITKSIYANFKPSTLLTLQVMPQEKQNFTGHDLVQALREAKFYFGKMSIFHRHEHANGHGKILFSAAKATEPGIFDLKQMEASNYVGLALFMQLLGPEQNLDTMDMFIQTAEQLSDRLNGRLMWKNEQAFTAYAKKHFVASVQHHLKHCYVKMD